MRELINFVIIWSGIALAVLQIATLIYSMGKSDGFSVGRKYGANNGNGDEDYATIKSRGELT